MLDNRRLETAHLLRRAGFGAKSPDELSSFAALTHEQAVAKLLDFDPNQTAALYNPALLLALGKPNSFEWGQTELQQSWFEIILKTPYPLQEKLALFWHGHFTSSINKVGDAQIMLDQNYYFRRNALGNFGQMVRDMAHDAAMLIYLDGIENRVEAPNENFARELMELFTLGTGKYSEQDIREAARAFTGWVYQDSGSDAPSHPQFVFDPDQHDHTTKTFMGVSGNLDADAIISTILSRRDVGYFIAREMWEFLVYADPSAELIQPLGDLFFDSGYDIRKLVEAILLHPDFLAPQAYRALVKSPVELIAGCLRALGVTRLEDDPLLPMAQSLFAPPNVKGWPGGKRWINGATFMARIQYFNDLLSPDDTQPDRLPLFSRYRAGQVTPAAGLAELAELWLDNRAAGLAEITNFVDSPYTSEATDLPERAREAEARLRGLAQLLLCTPEYQLN
jgi:hypothetical protein